MKILILLSGLQQKIIFSRPFLSGEDLAIVRRVYEEFDQFDYDALPESFVHGDMVSMNILKDESNDIWLIDFSVNNYMARLNEATVICDY